jgi:DNA-binding MarR family transcriptional regulator
VSFARIRLLQALETAGEATMSELAVALEVTQRRITALVDALEEDGLVERRPNPADKRSTLIAITPAGSRRQDVDWKRHQSDVALAFAELPAAQQRQLLEITPALTEIMRRRACERSDDGGERSAG